MSESLRHNGVIIEDEFAEAFDMKLSRLIVTAGDDHWVRSAAATLTGFATSVIECEVEMGVEQMLTPERTPDGRPGVSILALAMSGNQLENQIARRVGQCVLTCPTTAVFSGIEADAVEDAKPVPLGSAIRFFGDGHQISKVTTDADGGARRRWRIPVMDGEFLCDDQTCRVAGIGGGNFLLLGQSTSAVSGAARAAAESIAALAGVITPFPGGVTRSGSKVGSKYDGLSASTNEAYCPTLRAVVATKLHADEMAALEIVIDGIDSAAIAAAIRTGVLAACERGGGRGLTRITAGNYGGKLGRHLFHLREILA